MQFSCAASNINTHPDTKEVWVCNTDGYVGQVTHFVGPKLKLFVLGQVTEAYFVIYIEIF